MQINVHVVKVELPKLLAQDGNFKIGKVRIHSRDASFDELVTNSFELEKMVGEKGFAFFEMQLGPAGIHKMTRVEVQDPW